ncbi:Hypothetical Protein SLY_0076 [Strawberry lethal yellows phytoplasma (CPA) str. NZSb11]|uniref:Uncharacterized protein n=1 Tax=Strawberry lethal yellows phytoplasma (CPA) str. NZSb11 TaxID=980422 RepID=R4RVY8_PHYAS|nr:Hypothetical Protein SLY_0076 [Strawberry lethal yellows phytoplasma (CPA) str. NZSb11]
MWFTHQKVNFVFLTVIFQSICSPLFLGFSDKNKKPNYFNK